MRCLKHSLVSVVIGLALLNFLSPVQGKKPDNAGQGKGGGDDPVYDLVDLLGFDNEGLGYQSTARFITERVDGAVLIYGESYERYPDAPWDKYPALWHVDSNGNFLPDYPINLGLPTFAGEVEPTGFSNLGVGVGWTRRAVEKDENGNWVFPGYVDVPPYQELPALLNRDARPNGINDSGTIIGQYAIEDPSSPSGLRTVGGLWHLDPATELISGPESLGDFIPWDINSFGVMAGMHAGNPTVAWFDANDVLQMIHLVGSLRYFGADVRALNNYPITDSRLSVVARSWLNEAGNYNDPDSHRGVVWRPVADAVEILGTLGGNDSDARDVNSLGAVVGWSDTKKHGQQAFIYVDGVMSNLNEVTDVGSKKLQFAYGINDDGDIIGFMRIPRPVSEQRGFLLRPIVP